jgi:tRNA nucleotidyltransferase/poly(A) polymerase
VGDALRPLPPPVAALLETLERSGERAYALGVCARELARGAAPESFEIGTSAGFAALLARFPRGAVTGADRLTLASPCGPLDLHPFRGADLEGELARRDFSIHALALGRDGRWSDPFGGLADLAAGVLRAPGDAAARFAEDPLRALRAARLAAELGFELAPESEAAAAGAVAQLLAQRPARLRSELDRLLLAPEVERGLGWLRRLGIEALLAPEVAPDAHRIVARLPRDLELRLAAWLRGAHAVSTLRALRYPRARALRVERLLQLHPIEAGPAQAREQRVRRLARRSERDLLGLVALREAEIAVRGEGEAAARRLVPVRAALARAQQAERVAHVRAALAVDGADVMARLGAGPGSHVGRALRHLAECVAQDAARNRRETLLALLDAWVAEGGLAARRGAS